MRPIKVALAPFLRPCPEVITLGVRAVIDDYSPEQRELIARAARIFFPTVRFAEIFHAAKIPCFPSAFSYQYQRSRILQATLLEYLEWPHPQTRIYYGVRQKTAIMEHFSLPFVVMGPKATPETKHLIHDKTAFDQHAPRYSPVIVREFVPWRERVRMICVQFECLAAFSITPGGSGPPRPAPIPPERLVSTGIWELTERLLRQAQIDDIAIEWGYGNGRWQVIEMSRPPVLMERCGGVIHRHEHIGRLIRLGIL